MSTTVNRIALVDTLRALARVTQNNPTLPVLANVAIDSEDGQLTLITTNLDQFARRRLAFEGDPLPSLTVPVKAFADFAAGLGGDTLSLTFDKGKLRIAAGRQKASLAVIERDDFPTSFPSIASATSFTLSFEELADTAAFVVPFAATDTSRPILTGIQVRGDGTAIRFAAADNYRVGTVNVDHATTIDTVLPAVAFSLAQRVLAGSDVTITVAPNGVIFASDQGELFSRIIEGRYPNLDGVMPTEAKATILLDRDELAAAAKLTALADSPFVKFESNDEGLRIFVKDDRSDFDTTLEASFSLDVDAPEGIEFALAQKYVTAIATAFSDSTEIEVRYNGSLAPVTFLDPMNLAQRAVVMPVRSAK